MARRTVSVAVAVLTVAATLSSVSATVFPRYSHADVKARDSGEYEAITIFIDEDGNASAEDRDSKKRDSAADDAAAVETEGVVADRVPTIIGAVVGVLGFTLLLGCVACIVLRGRARRGPRESGHLGARTISDDHASLGALREYQSGEQGEQVGDAEGVIGGWWRRATGGGTGKERYAAHSLEVEFAKPPAVTKKVDTAAADGMVDVEVGAFSESKPRSGRDGSDGRVRIEDEQRQDGERPSPLALRGASLAEEISSDAWAQVERDVADIDYVIGYGPREDLTEWMDDMHLTTERRNVVRRTSPTGIASDADAVDGTSPISPEIEDGIVPQTERMEPEDPPLVNPYNFRRFPPPSQLCNAS